MSEFHLPWLELAILLPLIGAIVCRRGEPDRTRLTAMVVSGAALVATGLAWLDLIAVHTFEAHDRWTLFGWIPGGDPFFLDELSAPLLPLVALQFFLTIASTLRTKAIRFSFSLTLTSEGIALATLSTKLPWLLVILSVLSVVPVWVEFQRREQPSRFLVFHMGIFLLLLTGGVLLRNGNESSRNFADWLIALAVLVRSGAFPLHCWVSELFTRASLGSSILFVTPMTGAYLALRLLLPFSSSGSLRLVAAGSLLTAVYSAGMALVQRDARRCYAYLFLSHASLVLLGLELNSLIGFTGALCVWLSVGLAMLGFGLTLRCVESRVGRIDLSQFHGLHSATPVLAGLFLLTGLASVGFPGTIGFIAIEMMVDATVHTVPVIGVFVVIATALNGLAIMRFYFRVFTGCEHVGTIDLGIRPTERLAVLILSLLILGAGVYPQPGVASRQHAARVLLKQRAINLAGENAGQAELTPSSELSVASQDYQNHRQ